MVPNLNTMIDKIISIALLSFACNASIAQVTTCTSADGRIVDSSAVTGDCYIKGDVTFSFDVSEMGLCNLTPSAAAPNLSSCSKLSSSLKTIKLSEKEASGFDDVTPPSAGKYRNFYMKVKPTLGIKATVRFDTSAGTLVKADTRTATNGNAISCWTNGVQALNGENAVFIKFGGSWRDAASDYWPNIAPGLNDSQLPVMCGTSPDPKENKLSIKFVGSNAAIAHASVPIQNSVQMDIWALDGSGQLAAMACSGSCTASDIDSLPTQSMVIMYTLPSDLEFSEYTTLNLTSNFGTSVIIKPNIANGEVGIQDLQPFTSFAFDISAVNQSSRK